VPPGKRLSAAPVAPRFVRDAVRSGPGRAAAERVHLLRSDRQLAAVGRARSSASHPTSGAAWATADRDTNRARERSLAHGRHGRERDGVEPFLPSRYHPFSPE